MARFELDRLFGLALTDQRFFRDLCERPRQAMLQFDLTEPETQAVLSIAPRARSVQDLAAQLDSWMTSNALAAAAMPAPEPTITRHRLPRYHGRPSYAHDLETIQVTTHDKEQEICLKLGEYATQN